MGPGLVVIDVRRLRDEPEYRRGIERKRVRPGLIDDVIAADEERRRLQTEVQKLRERQNAASKEIGRATADARQAMIATAGALKEELATLEPRLAEVEARVNALALQLPNPADPRAPEGGEDDAVVLREVGRQAPAPALDHAAFGSAMGFVDTERAAEVSGSRFAYLLREGALLELALV
jgi:seryl-tRNA synthetase